VTDAVEQIAARLERLHPRLIDLSLDRLRVLLARLDHPERRLPPIIHVAGTNGKGSTCAFLRAIGEALGWRVHVTTSPHLVRLVERFRVAGSLVSEDALFAVLSEIETINAGAAITVFEVLAAAGFTLFARTPADLCVVEVGLGGRFDATNVVDRPACAVVASISMDHREFLGTTLTQIAREKAGVFKKDCPAVTVRHDDDVLAVLRDEALSVGADLWERGRDWDVSQESNFLRYRDRLGELTLPQPSLFGTHQIENAGLAVAALRASGLSVLQSGFSGIAKAVWPARMQKLHGKLAQSLPPGFDLFLDGGHNEGAGHALAASVVAWREDKRPLYFLVGMKQSKDAAGFLTPLLPLADKIFAVREPGQHLAATIEDIIAASRGVALRGPDTAGALLQVETLPPGRVVICGSLYLAGEVLKADQAELEMV